MNWSLIATVIWIVISFLFGLLELLLRYRWKDGRTQRYKIARKYLFVLFMLSAVFALVLTTHDKIRAEQALKQAADDRKIHAMAGQLETQKGLAQTFEIGDSGTVFVLGRSSSLLDAFLLATPFKKIAEQNSMVVGYTADGKLSVSARIRSHDGLVAEINDNEWKVNPSKSWDRNYSANAFEVKNADGEIVFQVKIVKDSNLNGWNVAHFQGIFFDSDGNGIGFAEDANSNCIISTSLTNRPAPLLPIKPLFKYPSELHLSELAN